MCALRWAAVALIGGPLSYFGGNLVFGVLVDGTWVLFALSMHRDQMNHAALMAVVATGQRYVPLPAPTNAPPPAPSNSTNRISNVAGSSVYTSSQ